MSNEKKRIVASIIRFINDEINGTSLNEDQRESLQVAKECFASTYGVSSDSDASASDLVSIFLAAKKEGGAGGSGEQHATATSEQRAEAERLKQVGNEAMTAGKYEDAEKAYTSAIELDGSNAVYYANRAAARSKLGNRYDDVVADCEKALEIDPNYAKAHYRLGCAHMQAGSFEQAATSLQNAVRLDSSNQTYQAALDDVMKQLSASNAGGAGLPIGDLTSMLSNPALMQTAMQMFQNPNMREMMSSLAGQIGAGSPDGAMGGGGGIPDMSALMRMGQQFAASMQQQNPELVEQLRRQFQQGQGQGQPPSGSS